MVEQHLADIQSPYNDALVQMAVVSQTLLEVYISILFVYSCRFCIAMYLTWQMVMHLFTFNTDQIDVKRKVKDINRR